MCGIAAIFNYRSADTVSHAEMDQMLAHMQRRGPDGYGAWYGLNGAIGLGHRRLAILDLSDCGAQPMVSDDAQAVISFNGEIYNFRELRRDLESRGRRFRSGSDTEVLLHLYQLEGENMLRHLRAMYAFAIWDERRRALFLARDPYGIKPLYYANDGQTFRAASQVKTLLAGGAISTSPDPAGHVGFFLWGHVPDPCTLHREVRSLPAGTFLRVNADGAGVPQPHGDIVHTLAARATTTAAASEPQDLRQAVCDSIRHHLVSDVPVGIFLSSGIDSAALTALVAETGQTPRTVTLGFTEYRGTPNDEVPLAETVARHYGAQHQTIWVTRDDFASGFEQILNAMDQPTCDGINSYFVSRAATQAGLKVALSGLGGDELLGGYPSFAQVPRLAHRLGWLRHAPCLGRGFRWLSAPLLRRCTSPKYAGLLEYGSSLGGAYLLRRGMFMPWELPAFLDPDLVREGWNALRPLAALNATAELSAQRFPAPGRDAFHCVPDRVVENGDAVELVPTAFKGSPAFLSDRLRITALESTWYMRHQLLRDTDWASMAHSLEVRVPLVDSALLRSLVPALNSARPPTKRDLALAPRTPLPDEILHRPKTGFTVPVRDWLLSASPLRLERGEGRGEVSNLRSRGLRGWTHLVYRHFTGN